MAQTQTPADQVTRPLHTPDDHLYVDHLKTGDHHPPGDHQVEDLLVGDHLPDDHLLEDHLVVTGGLLVAVRSTMAMIAM